MISCVCVTEDRPEFYNYLLWNYTKQRNYSGDRELLIIDSSYNDYHWPDFVRHVRVEAGMNIPKKRNLALEIAKGDIIAWFDDDDFQVENRLEIIHELRNWEMIGSVTTVFYNLETKLMTSFAHNMPLFNSTSVRVSSITRKFPEEFDRGSTSRWLKRQFYELNSVALSKMMTVFLCHEKNISNPASSWSGKVPLPNNWDLGLERLG